jgi:opacity protein-like surface antigen/molybdopterin converting factor small subunit
MDTLNHMKKLICFLVFLFSTSVAFSQSYSSHDYRRLSITLNGGTSFGDFSESGNFLSSHFSVDTKNTLRFGGGLQYALTPAWSLELGYQRTQIEGTEIPFETNMDLFTLKNIINLNQLFFVNRISDRLNPFVSLGIGYDFFNYNGPQRSFSEDATSYNAGAGLAFKLSNTVDLFTHYEYHLGVNSVDNETEGWGSDLINSLTGGIRINFGRKNTEHLSWRAVPVELSPSDYDRLMAQADLTDKLQNRMAQMEEHNTKKEKEFETAIAKNTADIDSLRSGLNNLTLRVDGLEAAFANLEGQIVDSNVDQETGMATSLADGHYVQIFSTYYMDIAQNVRQEAIRTLNESLPNPPQNIVILHRKKYYEVMIGAFSNFNDADNIQGIMTDVHDDSYVITFPRPESLMPDFEGMEVVQTKPLAGSQ